MVRNLVTTVSISVTGDVVSVNGSTAQNRKRLIALQDAIRDLVDGFDGGIWNATVLASVDHEERGNFGF